MQYAARLVLFAALTLAGCDSIDGISSGKTVQRNADDACVIQALKHTPGVNSVQQQTRVATGWTISGEGPRHGSQIRYFSYDAGTPYHPTFMIEDYGNGRYRYTHTMLAMNKTVPRDVIDQTLPIMRDAERHLARECRVDIDTGMKHTCSGSPCKSDDAPNGRP